MEKQRYFILFIFLLFSFNNNLYTATFTLLQEEIPIDINAEDQFGHTVAIYENYALIGARVDNTGAIDGGAAYFYKLESNTWTLMNKVIASDPGANDQFSYSLSISGEYAIIGSPYEDTGGADAGAAYFFKLQNGIWVEIAKVIASDAQANDQFGYSVAVSGSNALVGARFEDQAGLDAGAVYSFKLSGNTWTEDDKIIASNVEAGDEFGLSISMSNNKAVISAYRDDDGGFDAGAVYFYKLDSGGSWIEDQKVIPSDIQPIDRFGYGISISGDNALIGSYAEDTKGSDAGAAYFFNYNGISWTEVQKVTASDGEALDRFGQGVSISGNNAVIGAWVEADGGARSGAAYFYELKNGIWNELNREKALNPQQDDYFGYLGSLALSDDNGVIGAFGKDKIALNAGAVYFYSIPKPPIIENISLFNQIQNIAVISSQITMKSNSASISYEYGNTSGNYSSTTSINILNSDGITYGNLLDLNYNQRYYVRIRAENSISFTYSDEYSFILNEVNQSTDTDGDGVSDLIENASPNSGDGNGDGIQDALQTNVTSMLNSISGYYQTIVSNAGILLSDIEEVETESNSKYNFPFGAIKFKLNSSATTIKILYHGISKLSNYIYRKKRFGDEWFNFSNVVFGSENINGLVTAKVELTLKDGSDEDYDGMKNGFIIDPGGPAILIEDNIPFWNYWMLILTILVVIYLYHKYKTNESRKRLI